MYDEDFVLQDDKPWVIGEFVWTGFDYWANRLMMKVGHPKFLFWNQCGFA
jgi:hypothetical protein